MSWVRDVGVWIKDCFVSPTFSTRDEEYLAYQRMRHEAIMIGSDLDGTMRVLEGVTRVRYPYHQIMSESDDLGVYCYIYENDKDTRQEAASVRIGPGNQDEDYLITVECWAGKKVVPAVEYYPERLKPYIMEILTERLEEKP